MLSRKMSIEEKIIRLLYDRKFLQAVVMKTIFDNPEFTYHHKQSIRNAVSKLSKKHLIRSGTDGIILQPRGRVYIEKRLQRLHYFYSSFPSNAPKDLLVLFDIPEDRKAEREWFRKQLQEFGYAMIQKSVWLGPSPLPRDFVQYVKSIGLEECIKTFRLARSQQNKLKS